MIDSDKTKPIEPGALVMIIADHPETIKANGKNIGVTCEVIRRVARGEYLPDVHRHPCHGSNNRPMAAFDGWLCYGNVWYPPRGCHMPGFILRDSPQLMRIDGYDNTEFVVDKTKEKGVTVCRV